MKTIRARVVWLALILVTLGALPNSITGPSGSAVLAESTTPTAPSILPGPSTLSEEDLASARLNDRPESLNIDASDSTNVVAQPSALTELPDLRLIINGDFEWGPSEEWYERSTNRGTGDGVGSIITRTNVITGVPDFQAHSGEFVAWLGNGPNESSYLRQYFVVPPGFSVHEVEFYIWIESEEPGGEGCSGDSFWMHLGVDEVEWVGLELDLCADTNTEGWQRRRLTIPAYARTRQQRDTDISFSANLDAAHNSQVFIDGVRILGKRQSTAVGVIPGPEGCPPQYETVHIHMDNENTRNASFLSQWTGAIQMDGGGNTGFIFCRVDGAAFKNWMATVYPTSPTEIAYMVLRLGDVCPNGSLEFQRRFDNQNSEWYEWDIDWGKISKLENTNRTAGNIYPNRVGDDTVLNFCYFRGAAVMPGIIIDPMMSEFPSLGFEYGVFAHLNFQGGLAWGEVFTDDENDDNSNDRRYDPDASAEDITTINDIIYGSADTGLLLQMVDSPPPDEDFETCPEFGFCNDGMSFNPRPIDLSISLYRSTSELTPTLRAWYERAIEYFADGVYEMSNGVHVLRNVRIYADRSRDATANVVWRETGRASASASGYWAGRNSGGDQVFTFDRQANGGAGDAIDNGYRLAHEWGHYYYGLMDEYVGDKACKDQAWSCKFGPQTGDDAVVPSIMNNQYAVTTPVTPNPQSYERYHWLNFSSAGHITTTGNITFTENNAQYRTYEAPAWDVLTRSPADDPRELVPNPNYGVKYCLEGIEPLCWKYYTDNRQNLAMVRQSRQHFPELEGVAPDGGHLPRVDLTPYPWTGANPPNPCDEPQACDQLNITWDLDSAPASGSVPLITVQETVATSPKEIRFPVDSGMGSVIVIIRHPGGPTEPVEAVVRGPNGRVVGPVDCTSTGDQTFECPIEIADPEPGEWTTEVIVDQPPLNVEVEVIAEAPIIDDVYQATVESVFGPVVTYPYPVVVLAQVRKDLRITGANVTARAERDDGEEIDLSLRDDGVSPDAAAGDGLYTGYIPYEQNDDYHVRVVFDNEAGAAEFTTVGLEDAGLQRYPVGENFRRTVSTVITVQGVKADDHPGTAPEGTPLTPDNYDNAGRIDYAGDVDTFVITPTLTGKLAVRTTGLAFGMEPMLRVLDADATTVLGQARYDPAGGYPYIIIDVTSGQPVYAEVSHIDSDHVGGTFWVSAGQPISSDRAIPRYIYLPLTIRRSTTPSTGYWTTLVDEDFEGAFPGAWSAEDNVPGYGEYMWAKRTCLAASGLYSGWSVGGGAEGGELGCGTLYPNNVESWLIYGPFDLSDATAADLKFQLHLNSEPDYDWLSWMASVDGDYFAGWKTSGTSGGWVEKSLDLSDTPLLGDLTGESTVWIAFIFTSDGSYAEMGGAFLDDIVLRKYTSPDGLPPATTGVTAQPPMSGAEMRVVEAQTTLQK